MSLDPSHDPSPTNAAPAIAQTSPTVVPARPDELLAERRRWFRSFPEGPLEFVATIRIVCIFALFVIPLVGSFLRAYAALGLGLLLLAELSLTMWWVTRMATDRDYWIGGKRVAPARMKWAGLAPTVATVAAQTLLFAFAISFEFSRLHPGTGAVARWVALALYLVAIPVAITTCRAAGLRGRPSVVLLVVPFLHWWPVRRFATDISTDLLNHAARQSGRPAGIPRAALIVANILWAVLLLALAAAVLSKGVWSEVTLQGICSDLIIAAAAIADVAALESAQHAYLQYLRTAPPTRP